MPIRSLVARTLLVLAMALGITPALGVTWASALDDGHEPTVQPIVDSNMPYAGSDPSFVMNALIVLIGVLLFWAVVAPVVVQQRRKRVQNGAES